MINNNKQTDNKQMDNKQTDNKQIATEIINHLNIRVGSRFRQVKGNHKFIYARFKDDPDLTKQDFIDVIELKIKDWLRSPKMRAFLRPKTLFNETNFNQYIGQVSVKVLMTEKDKIKEFCNSSKDSLFDIKGICHERQ